MFIAKLLKSAWTGMSGLSGLVGGFSWDAFSNIVARYDFTDATTLKASQAAQFTASNSECLNISDNASLSTGDIDFTIAGWVYLDSKQSFGTIAGKRDAGFAGEYTILYELVADRFSFNIQDGVSGQNSVLSDSFGAASLNTWYFVVVWHDSVANTINIQINNGTVDSVATTITMTDTSSLFSVGCQLTTPAHFWDGRIDSLLFTKEVLTSDERTWLYNSGSGRTYNDLVTSTDANNPGTTNLVSFWALDESSGTRMDSHGSNHLTDNNTVTSAAGVVEEEAEVEDRARSFSTNDDLFTDDEIRSSDASGSSHVWIKSSGSNMVIWEKEIDTNNRIVFWVDGTGVLRFSSVISGSVNSIQGTTAVNDGDWHAVAVVSNGSTWSFFLDGASESSSVQTGANTGEWLGDIGSDSEFRIGELFNGTLNWSGELDEVMLFSDQLDSTDITELYNNGVGIVGAFTSSTLTSGFTPVHHWPLSENHEDGAGADLAGTSTLTDNGTSDAEGIPAGQTLDGSIARAIDQSGSSNDLVQATLSLRPELVNATTSLKAIEFDGADDYLDLSAFAGGAISQPNVIFVVFEPVAANNGTLVDSSNGPNRHQFFHNASDRVGLQAGSTITSAGSISDSLHVSVCVFNTASSAIYIDGGTAEISGDVGSETMDGLIVGSQFNGSGSFFSGSIREVIVNDGSLTDDEINEIGNYLANRHGLTWTDI